MLNVTITISGNEFSEDEKRILAALSPYSTGTPAKQGENASIDTSKISATETIDTSKISAPKVEEETPKAEEEEAPKPRRKRRSKAEIEAEKAAKEDEKAEAEEDVDPHKPMFQEDDETETEEESPEDLRKEAVKIASGMVSNGGAGEVRKALASVGAKKVSDVKDKDLSALIEALKGEK